MMCWNIAPSKYNIIYPFFYEKNHWKFNIAFLFHIHEHTNIHSFQYHSNTTTWLSNFFGDKNSPKCKINECAKDSIKSKWFFKK
jgi:hypothetical protein